MAQPSEMIDMGGIFNEMRRDLGEIEGFDIYSAMALQLKPNGLLMVSPRSKPDRGWMANVKSRRCYCNYCDIIFAVPKAG
jgi:hypothetical protein